MKWIAARWMTTSGRAACITSASARWSRMSARCTAIAQLSGLKRSRPNRRLSTACTVCCGASARTGLRPTNPFPPVTSILNDPCPTASGWHAVALQRLRNARPSPLAVEARRTVDLRSRRSGDDETRGGAVGLIEPVSAAPPPPALARRHHRCVAFACRALACAVNSRAPAPGSRRRRGGPATASRSPEHRRSR